MITPDKSDVSTIANAISAPVQKLVDVVSAGLGRLYEPTHIRRVAQAEGDRLVILADADQKVSDLRRRAAQRLLVTEEKRQINIENIVDDAFKELPMSVGSDAVSPDWIATFFEECKDVSSAELQAVWSKVLAGEVAKPGSYSKRTIRALRELSAEEAKWFKNLCSLVIDLKLGACFTFKNNMKMQAELGLTKDALDSLSIAGLITFNSVGNNLNLGPSLYYFYSPNERSAICVLSNREISIGAGTIALTLAGKELAVVAESVPNEDHIKEVIAYLRESGLSADQCVLEIVDDAVTMKLPDFALEYYSKQSGNSSAQKT